MTEDPTSSPNFDKILQELNEAVKYLANYRDEYLGDIVDKYDMFNESNESWINDCKICEIIEEVRSSNKIKHKAIQMKFETTMEILKQSETLFAHSSAVEKAQFCYLNGKALNTIQPETYTDNDSYESEMSDLLSQATQWLTRALKFNPQLADAWCELGDTCWRQGKPVEAANHFRQALKINPSHTESLCQLSMILRQLSPTKPTSITEDPTTTTASSDCQTKTETESSNPMTPLQESLQLAHDAVKNQPTHGHAWSVLGNALITLFFTNFGSIAPPPTKLSNSQDHTEKPTLSNSSSTAKSSSSSSSGLIMSRCLAAYAQAAKDRFTALEPNFHYNRGLAWHYQDLFGNALRCWLRSICLDPEWPAPRNCVLRLIRFLIDLNKTMKQFKLHADFISDSDDPFRKRQRQMIEDLIEPLSPCLLLCSSQIESNQDNSNGTPNGDQPNSNTNLLNKKQSAAVGRLLGPYYCSSTDSNSSLWSGVPNLRKGKKSHRSSRTNYHPITSLPCFQKLQFTLFSELKIGSNNDRVCCGRVLSELPSDSDLTLNLVLLDAQGTPLTIRLYNIGKGLGPVKKDIIAIPHPFVEETLIEGSLIRSSLMALTTSDPKCLVDLTSKLNDLQLTNHDQQIKNNESDLTIPNLSDLYIRLIRIPLPDLLIVNGHSVGSSWTAAPVLKNIFFTA